MPLWVQVTLPIVGILLAFFSLWLRLGSNTRARSWATGPYPDHRNALLLWPAIALTVGPFPLLMPIEHPDVWAAGAASLGFVATFPLGLLLLFWCCLQLSIPRWFYPAWARESKDLLKKQTPWKDDLP